MIIFSFFNQKIKKYIKEDMMRINKQEDIRDCGLYVLQSFIKKLQNKSVDIDYLKLKASYGPDGINLACLKELAFEHGLELESYSGDFESLKSLTNSNFPMILLLNREGVLHYVVLLKFEDENAYLLDSAVGKKIKVSCDTLKNEFTNVLIFVNKKEATSKNNYFTLQNKISELFSFKKYVYPLFIAALINLILVFASTFFIKIIFDYIMIKYLKKMLIITFVLFFWLNIVRYINTWFKNYVTKKVANTLEFTLNNKFFEKLRKAPLNQLLKLDTVDYLRRLGYIQHICEFQANFAYTFLSEIFSIIASCLLLIWLKYMLFLITFGVIVILFVSNLIHQLWLQRKYPKIIEFAFNKSQADLNHIQAFKDLSNTEYKNFLGAKQFSKMVNYKEMEYQLFRKTNLKNLINDIAIGNLPTVIVFVSCLMIFKNNMSTGTLMMFLTGMNFFADPLLSVSNLMIDYQMMRKNTELVNFMLNLQEHNYLNRNITIKQLKEIKLEDIQFAYESKKTILNIPSFTLNSNIQIKGKNGCGKTTFLNFLKGSFDSYTGQFNINGNSLKTINLEDYQNNIFLSTPQMFIPDLSIMGYLSYEKNSYLEELNKNIEKYNLASVLENMQLDITTSLRNNGSNISSGQRQLLILLKLFTRKYSLIMLDEGFENIDNESAKILKAAIKDYQNEALFIEISHNKNYIFKNKEVNFEQINKNF